MKRAGSEIITEINVVEKMLFESIQWLSPELKDQGPGLIFVLGEEEYAVMVCGQKPEDYDFKNTVPYPKARFTFIMDFINDRQTIGFIPACEAAEQELGLLNLKPHISVSIPDNAVSLAKSITLYGK